MFNNPATSAKASSSFDFNFRNTLNNEKLNNFFKEKTSSASSLSNNFSENIKVPPLKGPHDYGTAPNHQGAINFARDTFEANSIPVIKEVLNIERSRLPYSKLELLINIITPTFLLIGLIAAVISFVVSYRASSGYGLQKFFVDSQLSATANNSAAKYKLNAKATSYQSWLLRNGEWGNFTNIEITIPDADKMQVGSIITVKNGGIGFINSNTQPASLADDIKSNIVKIGQQYIVIPKRTGINLIVSDAEGGIKRWYPALLPPGSF